MQIIKFHCNGVRSGILRAQAGQTKCPWSSCRVTRTLSLSRKHAYKVANFDINYGNAFFLESEKEEGRKLFC